MRVGEASGTRSGDASRRAGEADTEFYFAYGSNLSSSRLRERIGAVEPIGPARVRGWGLRIDKLGGDGTAKANLVPAPEEEVWGMLWRVPPSAWERLDRYEGGYRRIVVEAERADGSRVTAQTYRSERRMREGRPTAAYAGWILAGAREHALPAAWIAHLERLLGGAA